MPMPAFMGFTNTSAPPYTTLNRLISKGSCELCWNCALTSPLEPAKEGFKYNRDELGFANTASCALDKKAASMQRIQILSLIKITSFQKNLCRSSALSFSG